MFLDIKHSKENLQTVLEEFISLCHRCPKDADGQPELDSSPYFIYLLMPEEENIFVQAAELGRDWADLKGGKWEFEIVGESANATSGLSEREELELNSLGWHYPTGGFFKRKIGPNLVQAFSEGQVLRGNTAANIMDAFRRYRTVVDPSMARVQIETSAELIRLTEKDFESDQRRRETIPRHVKTAVWRRDQGRCTECDSKEKLEYDHIIPWSKGGSDTERNIQLLCERCNRTKSASI